MTGHQKDNLFVLTVLLGRLLGGVEGLVFGPKLTENLIFLRYTHITCLFWAQTAVTQWDLNFPIS